MDGKIACITDATFDIGALRGDLDGGLGWPLECFALDGERKAAMIVWVFNEYTELFPGDDEAATSVDANFGGGASDGERIATALSCALDGDSEAFAEDDEVDRSGDVELSRGSALMGFDSPVGDGDRIAATIACFLASDLTVFLGEGEAVVDVGFVRDVSMRFDSTVDGAGFISGSKHTFIFGADGASMAAGGGAVSLGTDDGSDCSGHDASAPFAGDPKCLAGDAGDPSPLTFLTFIAFPVGELSASTSMGTVN